MIYTVRITKNVLLEGDCAVMSFVNDELKKQNAPLMEHLKDIAIWRLEVTRTYTSMTCTEHPDGALIYTFRLES